MAEAIEKELEEKRTLIQQEIIDKKYDQTKFIFFV